MYLQKLFENCIENDNDSHILILDSPQFSRRELHGVRTISLKRLYISL